MMLSPNKPGFRAGLLVAVLPGLLGMAGQGHADPATDIATAASAVETPAATAPVDAASKSILPAPVQAGPVLPPAQEKAGGDGSDQTATAPIPAAPGDGSAITVGVLGQVDPSSVGLIDPTSGGFPSDMWARSDRTLIERLIPQFVPGSHSPVLQGLSRRILVTAASAPAGAAGVPSLLALRLDRLAKAGDLPDVLDLLGRLPPDIKDIEVSRLKVNAALLAGDFPAACGETANIVPNDPDPYWAEVLGYCHAIEGDMPAAALAVEMLQDKGVNAPFYYQLMARLTAANKAANPALDLSKFNKPDPLLLSMIQSAGLEIPPAVLPKASPLMLQALATNVKLPIDLRVEAAERAARNGSLSPEKLAEIYGAVTFTPEELAKAVDLAGPATAPRGARLNALLYQAAAAAQDIKVLGPLLDAISAGARRFDMLALQARVNVGVLTGIEPSAEAMPYITEISRLLLLAGKYERVGDWYEFARLRAETDDKPAAEAMRALWPLATMADTQKALPWSPDTLDQWWQGQPAQGRQDRGALLFAILEAMGYQIPDAAWTRLLEGAPLKETAAPALPYWRALLMAARDKRLGETALLSLIAMGEGGPGKASPVMIGNVMTALGSVGLNAEARKIAIEALVARDF